MLDCFTVNRIEMEIGGWGYHQLDINNIVYYTRMYVVYVVSKHVQ